LTDDELFPLGEKALHDVADDIIVLNEIRNRFRLKGSMRGYSGWKDFVDRNSRYSIKTIQRRLQEVNGKDESKANRQKTCPDCLEKFPSKTKLKAHQHKVHRAERPTVVKPAPEPMPLGHGTAMNRQASRRFMKALGDCYNSLKEAVVVSAERGFNIEGVELDEDVVSVGASKRFIDGLKGLFQMCGGDWRDGVAAQFLETETAASKWLAELREFITYEVDEHQDQDLAIRTLRCCRENFDSLTAVQQHRTTVHCEKATGAGFAGTPSIAHRSMRQTTPCGTERTTSWK
jgi:hypothetical protein